MSGQRMEALELPKCIEVFKTEIYAIRPHAVGVGIKIYDLHWPRRHIANNLQLRLDYYLDAGGVYKDYDGEIFPITENSIDDTFGEKPDYKWFADFPRQCKFIGLKKSPSKPIQLRLQIIDLALRTPPLGMAI